MLWTSSDVPLMAAMAPVVPGNCRAAPPLDPVPATPLAPPPGTEAAVDAEVDADEDPPHAARVSAATARTERARVPRAGAE